MATVEFTEYEGVHSSFRGLPIVGSLEVPLLCFGFLDLDEPVTVEDLTPGGQPQRPIGFFLPEVTLIELQEIQDQLTSYDEMEASLEWMRKDWLPWQE